MRIAAGVDVGSTQTKAVIVDESRTILARILIPTGANVSRAALKAKRETSPVVERKSMAAAPVRW